MLTVRYFLKHINSSLCQYMRSILRYQQENFNGCTKGIARTVELSAFGHLVGNPTQTPQSPITQNP